LTVSDPLTIRFRVDFGSRCSVGIGKIQLLEAIDRSGSLSQAARLLKMSYRRAWLLMADLNTSFDQPVVGTTTGGARGGGAVLTPLGSRLVASYRKLESALQPLANRCFSDLRERIAFGAAKRGLRPRSNKRRAASHAVDG